MKKILALLLAAFMLLVPAPAMALDRIISWKAEAAERRRSFPSTLQYRLPRGRGS
ncbi:MAG: hypothetical protein J5822_06815 [Eubacteriaceae bacterium]|nr:hypothetical protein [Eubacteriaceae bacterium]